MDFSKLNRNEKLAVYGSVAVILHGLNGRVPTVLEKLKTA